MAVVIIYESGQKEETRSSAVLTYYPGLTAKLNVA